MAEEIFEIDASAGKNYLVYLKKQNLGQKKRYGVGRIEYLFSKFNEGIIISCPVCQLGKDVDPIGFEHDEAIIGYGVAKLGLM